MTQRTCALPECDSAIVRTGSRGSHPKWCASHNAGWKRRPRATVAERNHAASAAYQASRAAELAGLPCAFCGSARPDGSARAYCSKSCQSKSSYARRKGAISAAAKAATVAKREAIERSCDECDGLIPAARSMRARYCSIYCSRNAARDNPATACAEPACDRPVRARGVCNMHYKRLLRAEGNLKADPWGERRRTNWKKRQAAKRGATGELEPINPRDVFDRDGWTCGLCAELVDPNLAWPDAMSASLDHIVPLSKGGAHSMANVQCAHLSCNVKKGNRVAT